MGEDLIPRGTVAEVKELKAKLAEHEEILRALLVAVGDIETFTGRGHMPAGKYLDEEFGG